MKMKTKVKFLLILVAFCFFGFGFCALANGHLASNPLTANTTGVRITDLAAKSFGWLWFASVALTMLVEAWWAFQLREKLGSTRFVVVLLLLVCVSIFAIYLNYFLLLKPADRDFGAD
jgi:hypothetical protein